MKPLFTVILVCLMVGCIVGFIAGYCFYYEPFPSIREWQVKIGCEKIDGKLGDSWQTSETQDKWRKRYYKEYGVWMY